MLFEILTPVQKKEIEETGDLDFGYEVKGIARYRCNYFKQKNGIGAYSAKSPRQFSPSISWGSPRS